MVEFDAAKTQILYLLYFLIRLMRKGGGGGGESERKRSLSFMLEFLRYIYKCPISTTLGIEFHLEIQN